VVEMKTKELSLLTCLCSSCLWCGATSAPVTA